MRSALLFLLVAPVFLPGCGRQGDPVPEGLMGKWIQESPDGQEASPQARALELTYDFKPDGRLTMSYGPMLETRKYRIREGKLMIDGREPLTIHEQTADRLVIGDGPGRLVFTR